MSEAKMEEKNVELGEENIIKCGKCTSEAFTEIVVFGKVPAVISPTGKAGIAPVGGGYICMNCGTSLEETKEVKELMTGKDSGLIL
jgi:DNA-directed RNA polymerase subunit RPC12/RpoP